MCQHPKETGQRLIFVAAFSKRDMSMHHAITPRTVALSAAMSFAGGQSAPSKF